MKILGQRVDALTLAFRVRFDPSFLAVVKERAEIVRAHGRAAFSWSSSSPDVSRVSSEDVNAPIRTPRHGQKGPRRMFFGSESERARRAPRLWGEMGFSAARGVWRITNPQQRFQIKEHAEGGGQRRECTVCKGSGWCARSQLRESCSVLLRERCTFCGGVGEREDPGWTLEIIWSAQELAIIGLERALSESEAIAAELGEVMESRLRRLDLCSDVEGWEVATEDLRRIVKRPRARWSVNDAGPGNDTFEPDPKPPTCGPRCKLKKPKTPDPKCACEDVMSYGSGGVLARRRLTGISIGRGGALMARIYDKRAELEREQPEEGRRALEEKRWTKAGWDGVSPVARVEFQIRGVALVELGIRDPDACLVPVMKHEAYTDARGKRRVRAVVLGSRVLTALEDGIEVQATIVHRLEAVWRTCLDWVRLVVPAFSSKGKPIAASRLEDDPRWALLRTVKFGERFGDDDAIRRYRPRTASNWAQALGVSLSQAGRDGLLHEDLPEALEAYGDDDAKTDAALFAAVLELKTRETRMIVDRMIERYHGVAQAAVHFAVRSNAARVRWMSGVELVWHQEARARPPPLGLAWKPSADGQILRLEADGQSLIATKVA